MEAARIKGKTNEEELSNHRGKKRGAPLLKRADKIRSIFFAFKPAVALRNYK